MMSATIATEVGGPLFQSPKSDNVMHGSNSDPHLHLAGRL